MKTRTPAFICWLAGMVVCLSCSFGNRNNTNITLSESEQEYNIAAQYPQAETRKVEEYLTRKLSGETDVQFTHTHINAELTLNDGTVFYIKHKPGKLAITFDKNRNSAAAYRHIKALGEGLKNLLK